MIGLVVLVLAGLWILYPYAIYPFALRALRPLAAAAGSGATQAPKVSVIVAAFDEEEWIGRKIESTLQQDYPADAIEVWVVSDGSTDRTDAIVAGWEDSRVALLRQERSGKTSALNLAVSHASGEILVFTDANALFCPGAIRELVTPFADPRVALVSGQGLYGELGGADARAVSGGYVRLEAMIRSGEGARGVLAGADGAIYALRRDRYRELEAHEVNDLVHPLEAALAGDLCRFAEAACTVEPASSGGEQELSRHARMIAQGWHAALPMLPRLAASGRWMALWALVSHRVLRWSTSLAFLSAAVATSLLLSSGQWGVVAYLAVAAQLAFYGLATAGWAAERRGASLGVLAMPYYFAVVSIAGVLGFRRFLAGGGQAVWSPRGAST